MRRLAALSLLALALAGCGPDSALWLRVEAPLSVPGDCDALKVEAHRGAADGPVLFERTFDLAAGPQFPLTLSLGNANGENLGEAVSVKVTALSAGALARPWSAGQASATLERGKVSQVLVRLCDCQ
ncbi:MAG: hypothetical protein ACYC8T_17945 [Myxococcaceae bacterium]